MADAYIETLNQMPAALVAAGTVLVALGGFIVTGVTVYFKIVAVISASRSSSRIEHEQTKAAVDGVHTALNSRLDEWKAEMKQTSIDLAATAFAKGHALAVAEQAMKTQAVETERSNVAAEALKIKL